MRERKPPMSRILSLCDVDRRTQLKRNVNEEEEMSRAREREPHFSKLENYIYCDKDDDGNLNRISPQSTQRRRDPRFLPPTMSERERSFDWQ